MRALSFVCLSVALIAASNLFPLQQACAQTPSTLAQALVRTTDTARRRVPLLVIDAGDTRVQFKDGTAGYELAKKYSAAGAKPPLADVLEAFNRQMISCATVQVIAPIKRFNINPEPGRAEEWGRIGREQAAKALFASLTPTQWQSAASASGLTLAQLEKPEQKAWFLSLLPEPFVIQQVSGTANPARTRKTISPEQIHLRVVRKMDWLYTVTDPRDNRDHYFGYNHDTPMGAKLGDSYWQQVTEPAAEPEASYKKRLADTVWVREPNKLKPSDLGFNKPPLFGKTITLAGVKTVGDLVQRVAQKTGLELYADRRLNRLSVTVLGQPESVVDAADIMKALCYAVGGAIRKVSSGEETVYLLVRDRDGFAAPRLQLGEWQADVDALVGRAAKDFDAAARDDNLLKSIGFAEDAPALSPSLMAQVENRLRSPELRTTDYAEGTIAVSELDPRLQQLVKTEIDTPSDFAVISEKNKTFISPMFSLEAKLFVPGYGNFDGIPLARLGSLMAKRKQEAAQPPVLPGSIALPQALTKFAALRVDPASDADADLAVAWARKHGFRALLVRTSLWDAAMPARLAHLAAQGKANGVEIYPAVSLFLAPPPDAAKMDTVPHNLPRARNVLGETLREYAERRQNAVAAMLPENAASFAELKNANTEEWLDASAVSVQDAVEQRVTEIARTPGISGIVLTDSSAPGFAIADGSYNPAVVAGRFAGYGNDALRVALIRGENIDPWDVPASDHENPLLAAIDDGFLLYYADSFIFRTQFNASPIYRKNPSTGAWTAIPSDDRRDDVAGWNALRRAANRAWVGQLRKKIILPEALPLLWEAPPSTVSFADGRIQRWLPGDAMPPEAPDAHTLLPIFVPAYSTPELLRYRLGVAPAKSNAAKKPPYTGVVITVTGTDTAKALTLLDCLQTIK